MSQTEVVDPIVLATKVVEHEDKCCSCCCGEIDVASVPEDICRVFDDILVDSSEGRNLYITIGLFTIVQLERDVQILVPAYDFCIPDKECTCDTEDPCDSFRKIKFPIGEFFPGAEKSCDKDNNYPVHSSHNCGCGCGK